MDIIGELSFRELPCKFGDGEEALSLSGLPLTSNSSDWEEEYFSYIRGGGQSPCCDQDLFEFFSEDFSASCDALNLADNVVVFYGKLIPYREAQVPIRVQEPETNDSCSRKPKEAGKRSSRPLFTRRSSDKQVKSTNEGGKRLAATSKGGRVGVDTAMRKMQVLSSPLKSRWYLFAFGVGRFPMAMERSDMKTRQSKKSRSNYPTSDRREMSNSSSRGSSSSGRSSNSSGSSLRTSILWSILNNIGCKNQYLMENHEQHRL